METELFLSGIQTIDEERERDVGQVPASARLSGIGAGQAEEGETEADGAGRRDIHTAITILRGGNMFTIDDAIEKCKDRANISALHHMPTTSDEWSRMAHS